MTNVRKLKKLAAVYDGYATWMWLLVSALLSSLVMWVSESTTYLYDWIAWGIITLIFFAPGGLLLLILHIYHSYKINDILTDACSKELFESESFHSIGKDLAVSEHFLIYVAKIPVIVRRLDVQGVHLQPNKVVLSTTNGPFAYLYPDEAVIHAIEEWAHAEWICPNCGAHMDVSYVFCSACGYHREVVAEQVIQGEKKSRSIVVAALIVLIVLAMVLVYCGIAKPVERRMELEPDGYLSVACEQMLKNGL